jgi:isoquinoline 1-oxidoreductase beta subunit
MKQSSRRDFLKLTAISGTGLMLGLHLPLSQASNGKEFEANAFITVNPDNSIIFTIKHFDMGQGTHTGLATLLAEEMDADWQQVRTVAAPADASRYGSSLMGGAQLTGGSTAIRASYQPMREAGAAARAMLVAAAATKWGLRTSSLNVSNSVVSHAASGRSATFGELANLAARQSLPDSTTLTLKTADQFVYIGKQLDRKDLGKHDGTAIYTQDIFVEGMLVAVVARPSRFGAVFKSVDSAAAKAIAGVTDVLVIPSGVAVLAKDYWTAQKGRAALNIEWDDSKALKLSSEQIMQQLHTLAAKPGLVATNNGDSEQAMAKAAKVIESSLEFPYLAHAPMEAMNCVMRANGDSCEVWSASQGVTLDQTNIARVLDISPSAVTIHIQQAGGSFGRRATGASDFSVEAAAIAKQKPGTAIKLVWSREDDIKGGYYRPAFVHKLKAGLDKNGNVIAWQQRIVGQSIMRGNGFADLSQDAVDNSSVEGAANLAYQVPNLHVDAHNVELPIPVLWWRSVGHTHTAFATETFIDQLAAAAGKDPVAFRLAMLGNHPRHQGVLKLAAEKAGWGKKLPQGVYRGVAVHESFKSFVAQVAEVAVNKDGSYKVLRVVCAVDCGVTVNPDIIKSQIEGGIGFAMSPLLMSAITFTDGKVNESNFHDYQVLRMPDMPIVEVHIVNSMDAPSGIGEPGVPPLAPAVANALFAATGNMPSGLPIKSARS